MLRVRPGGGILAAVGGDDAGLRLEELGHVAGHGEEEAGGEVAEEAPTDLSGVVHGLVVIQRVVHGDVPANKEEEKEVEGDTKICFATVCRKVSPHITNTTIIK